MSFIKSWNIQKFFLMVLVMFLVPISVFAKDTITLKVDKTTLEIGDEISVIAKINSGAKYYALTATLSYDESVFESIDDSSFFMPDDTDVIYNTQNKKFGIINKTGEISNELFQVRLKVKKEARAGTSVISLTNISSSDGKSKINFEKTSANVLITKDAKDGEVLPSQNTQVNEQKEEDIKTFSTKPIIYFLMGMLIASFICLVYVLIKRKEKKIVISFIGLSSILLLALISLFFMNNTRKDVNNDGNKTYDDAKEIMKYILDIKGTEPNNQENNDDKNQGNIAGGSNSSSNTKPPEKNKFDYDVNNDGKVDIEDVGGSTEDTTENIQYKVVLSERNKKDVYVKKGSITLEFDATVTNNEEIREVEIDGQFYPVNLNENFYSVTLNTPNTPGIHEFKFTTVKLANNRKINTNLSIKKDILKEDPYVDLFSVNDQENTFDFQLEDKDHSIKSGNVMIVDDKNQVVFNEKLNEKNHYFYHFEKDIIYNVYVIVDYDLDSNEMNSLTGEQNLYEEQVIYNHKIMVASNYNFQISNVNITDAIEKDQSLILSFDSSNSLGYTIDYIVINGKEYPISSIKEKNHYQVILNNIDTSQFGKYYLNIEKIVLQNLKAFENQKDYEIPQLNYTVLKYAPKVENISIQNNEEEQNLSVSYQLEDTDETLEKLTAVLMDSTNKIVDRIENIDPNEMVTLSYKENRDGRYYVKFFGDCNLGTDRHKYQDKLIGEKEILTQKEISIKNAKVTTEYPTKNAPKYKITFEVEVSENFKKNNRFNVVSGITINGLNYDADKTNAPFTSTISFTVPSESGILELVANRVQLQYEDYNNNIHEFFSVEPYTIQIDVLKDKPSIQNLEVVNEDYQSKTTTFQFDVIDDKGGFETGEIELNGIRKKISIGKNEVTFTDIEVDKALSLNFYSTYDLDTNTLKDTNKDLNHYENEQIYSVFYGLYDKNTYDNITLTEIVLANNKSYFEKNEEILMDFGISGLKDDLDLSVTKLIISGQEYNVSVKNQKYETILEGWSQSGIHEKEITDVIFNNGKKVTLKNPIKIQAEILKDPVRIYDFKYEITEEDITLKFTVKDEDRSIMGPMTDALTIRVLDEENHVLLEKPYEDEISFAKQKNIVRYYIQVLATYDRDQTKKGDNYVENEILVDEVISMDKNYITLKEISDITLYKEENGLILTMDTVNVSDLENHLDAYFVKTSMNGMPTVHSKIEKVIKENNHLVFILDYEYVTKENAKEKQDVRIDFGTIQDGKANNEARPETFENLIQRIKENPNGEFTLTHDFDAADITVDTDAYFAVDFKGQLHGNGHKILNLKKPLFSSITGGTVENIKLENINLPANNAQGTLANKVTKAVIRKIYIHGFTKKESDGISGTLIGEVTSNSIIEECKSTNFVLNTAWAKQQVGGLIGILDSSTIKNSYVEGSISSSWNYVGGMVGNVKGNSVMENNYAKVNMNSDYLSCGFACVSSNQFTVKNNVNLSTGKITHKFITNFKNSENNYQLESEGYSPQTGVTIISKEEVSHAFTNAQFDNTIWNLEKVSWENPPKFLLEKETKIDKNKVTEYNEAKEILYHNLMLLMPFYEDEKIVKSGEQIAEDHILNQQEIRHIIPIDETGNIVTYLTTHNPKKIKKIMIIFKNDETLVLNTRFDNVYDMVASYRITDLKIDYVFNHYIIDSNSQLVNNITNYLALLTYEDHLDPLTPSLDSRIYKDYYNDVTKKELKEFVLKYLSNSNYTNSNSDEVINDYLEKEIKKDKKIEKVLYVYNYFKRFYSVSINGIALNDLVLFNSQGFHESLTPYGIATLYLANESNFKTDKTSDAYTNTLAKFTNLSTIPKLLEYYVTLLSKENMSTWYANSFKGYLVEINVDEREDILYTLWDHISYEDQNNRAVWYNYALPLLTIPENAAYIISTPTQFLIGSQRVYIKNPDDPKEQKKFQEQAAIYTKRMKDYYETSAKILNEAQYFNEIHTIQVDKRFTYDQNDNSVFQSPYTTEEPFHKNFNEVFGLWAHQDGNAATANGTVIYWRAEGALEGEWTYHTWSHETAHNIDARLFLKNNGRRFDAGGEDYADSNLMQYFGDGDIVMNFSRHFGQEERISSNLDPSRIDSPEKVHDFYRKLFETVYILDYLEGKALLTLTPEEQAKLVVQASYPNETLYPEEKDKHLRYKYTVYQQIDTNKVEEMNLTTIDDLYKNQLVMYPGVIYSTLTDNRYGGEGIYKVHWYQPHNDYGRPDSYSIKWFAYEMLGYKGYDDGYIEYFSNIHSVTNEFYKNYKTDLMALRTITGDENMTYEIYKHQRFAKVEENLESIQFINVDQIYQRFIEALKEDANYVIQIEQEAYAKYPGEDQSSIDARNKMISNARQYKNSTEIRREVFYTLKQSTNDFEEEVYDKTNTQIVTFLGN